LMLMYPYLIGVKWLFALFWLSLNLCRIVSLGGMKGGMNWYVLHQWQADKEAG